MEKVYTAEDVVRDMEIDEDSLYQRYKDLKERTNDSELSILIEAIVAVEGEDTERYDELLNAHFRLKKQGRIQIKNSPKGGKFVRVY